MKTMAFSTRNAKEILRDPINVVFGLGFPAAIMLLFTMIQRNVPFELYALPSIAPGISVFSLSFVALFSGMVIARDRESSFILRLFASPMRSSQFIAGYTLPMLLLSVSQILCCFVAALILGLPFTFNIIGCVIVLLPASALFIGIGLLCGSLLTDRQVGGICGALLTNLSAWLSGTWFSLDLVGGAFKSIANLLPFVHAVNAGKSALSGNYGAVLPDLLWVVGYAAAVLVLAIFVFQRKMAGKSR